MKIERDNRLDALKAISIIFVLIWHLRPISFFVNNDTHIIIVVIARIVRDLELQLSLLAVPLFFLVSLYLFLIKKPDKEYLKIRLIKIFKLFTFWSIFHNIFLFAVTREVPDFSWDIITGLKPSLPFAGDSVFYFLFNLMVLTIISFLFCQINSNKFIKLLSSVTIIFTLLYFETVNIANSSIPYHWLSNFIVYIPIAFYLANYSDKVLKFRFYYLVAYILFSLHDIYLRIYGYNQSIYGRISIVCAALTLFCYVYTLKIPENWYIQKLSQYSLGLFAIHKYWQSLLFLLVQHYQISLLPSLVPLNIMFPLMGALVVLLTIVSIYLLKSTSLKQFIG
ncbi:MAG: acyltransferase [Calothrix sp. FI2-JRJ7]|jgi:surface polysaccharide O-acyltransferase-like enzyme|nr:acyltransferase [Calothrix sp. FI2-JRJ7]